MREPRCAMSIPLPELLAYWLGEMDEVSQAGLEEHLFSCAECSGRLARLVELTKAIGHELHEGRMTWVLPAPFVEQLKDAGTHVREYRMQPGGSVNCTVAPGDDLVVSHLAAPLRDVRRLDLIFDAGEHGHWRLQDVAFDPASDEVVFAPSVRELRKLGVSTNHAQLVAVTPEGERVIGSYTFNHSPYR